MRKGEEDDKKRLMYRVRKWRRKEEGEHGVGIG